MGPFSSKTKIDVFSNAIQLVDEDYDATMDIIISALLTGNNVADGIISGMLAGASKWTDRMLNYARNDYTLGLAAGVRHTTVTLEEAVVETALTTDLSLPYGCLVDYAFITGLTIDFVVLPFLINQRNYNIATNTIIIYPPGLTLDEEYQGHPLVHKVTIDTVILSTDQLDAIITYSITSSYDVVTEPQEYGDPKIHTLNTLPVTYYEETYLLPPGLRIGRPYCIAKYFVLDAQFEVIQAHNWWFYDITTGVYPTIDVVNEVDEDNHFFPVVPLRYNNQDLTDVSKHETDLYKTSKILLKRAGLDIQDLGDTLNTNEDVGEMDHAYVMWGINLQTENTDSLRYLVEFFDYLYDEAVVTQNDFINFQLNDEIIAQRTYGFNNEALIAPDGTTTRTEYIEDDWDTTSYQVTTTNTTKAASLVEHGLDTSVGFSFISSVYVNGSIGGVGTVTKAYEASTGGSRSGSFRLLGRTDNSTFILRYQETVATYKEIKVVGLHHINRIYDGYAVWTTVGDVFNDPDEDNFIIPIHYGISKRLGLSIRNELYLQSLHIVINGVVKTKVKWYERGMFKAFLKLIAIVVAVYFQQWWALAAMAAMEILVRVASPEFLAAIKILYIAYSLVTANIGNIASTLSTAVQFLKNVMAISDLAQIPMQLKIADTMGEIEDLAVEHEVAMKELEEIRQQLDTGTDLDVESILLLDGPTLSSFSNESPTAFYIRTLQNNAGLLTLNVVENYHTALLQLPEPDYDTVFGVT